MILTCIVHNHYLTTIRFRVVTVSLPCFLLLCSINSLFAEPLKVVSYNVENLFHPEHDSLKDDYEWTANGERRWSYTRYYKKEDNLARVLTNIGEWDGVDVIGLQEVENTAVVKRLCYTLRRNEYDFVHYESPDPRGIDVALVYKKSRVDTLSTKAISLQNSDLRTRDASMSARRSISAIPSIFSSAICRANEAEKQKANGNARQPNKCWNKQ